MLISGLKPSMDKSMDSPMVKLMNSSMDKSIKKYKILKILKITKRMQTLSR